MQNPRPGKSFAQGFALLTFVLLMVLLYLFSDRYFRESHNPNQNPAMEKGALHLNMAGDGHYRASGMINGVPVVFLLDTGASGIAVNEEIAHQAGLKKGQRVQVNTANGTVTAWQTMIDTIELGGLISKKMPATILPNMETEVLLGMRYLRQFHWRQKDGELWLEYVPK